MPEAGFTSLAYYIDLEWLKEAYKGVRKNGATGVDEVTAEEYEKDLEENLRSLLERFKSGRYYAPAVKRALGSAHGSLTCRTPCSKHRTLGG
jgi:retron-type reverse transcriptase